MEKNNYIREIPFIRSIACIMVVMVHVTASNYTSDGFANSLSLYLNQFSRLGTPIFAIISAYLLMNSTLKNGFSLKRFITSRTVKIISPFIIWSLVYLWLEHYKGSVILTNPKDFLNNFILGDSYMHLYFIVTVIHFYLLFPLLQLIRNRMAIFVLFIVSIPLQYIWLNKLYVDHIQIFSEFSYIIDDRSFILNWIAYFMFGAVLAQYYDEIASFTKKHLGLFLILFGVLAVSIYIEIEPGQLFTSTRVANIIYIPIFTLFLLAFSKLFIKNENLYKPFKLIGDYSMGIYLVHPFIIYFLNIYLPNRFFEPELIFITIFIVLIISTLIIRLISLVPKSTFIVPIPKINR